tara:strand:+ start:3347 stop:3565 length:219 start_codon:yes stop_codon:yes gene_type:complete
MSIFILTILIPPAHAYAGPGVAIGAIVVALTVLFAFFSSLIIKIFNLIISFLRYIKRKLQSKKKLKKTNKNK